MSYALNQASAQDTDVILLGDYTNKGAAERCHVKWEDKRSYEGGKWWERFDKAYIHLSTNSEDFEKNCFKRFFDIRNFIEANNIDRFIYLDSDILIYDEFAKFIGEKDIYAGMCVPKSCYNEHGWNANCGISVWTAQALASLTEFFVHMYEDEEEVIRAKYENNHYVQGGICDMSLEGLFYIREEAKGKKCYNFLNTKESWVMDYAMASADSYEENVFEKDEVTGIKRVVFENHCPYFIRKSDNTKVKTYGLHFQGDKKRFMKDYYENEAISKDTYKAEKHKNTVNGIKKTVRKIIGKK